MKRYIWGSRIPLLPLITLLILTVSSCGIRQEEQVLRETLLQKEAEIDQLNQQILEMQTILEKAEGAESARPYQDFFKRVDHRRIKVSGHFSYPSEGIPPSTVAVMRNLVTGETYRSKSFSEIEGRGFELEVPLGFYHCYMYRKENDFWYRVYENILVLPGEAIDLDGGYPSF